MTVLPTVDQFPSFVDTLSWLTEGACQCIWYLPNRRRWCYVAITTDANQSMLSLAESVFRMGPLTRVTHRKLTEVAEKCCCGQYHYNKIYGNELSQRLALRWLQEVRVALSVPTESTVFAPPSIVPNKSVAFAKREVGEGDTLVSQLLSSIDRAESPLGSVYIFTHRKAGFIGMIKIGYTSQEVQLRMVDWATCGHGHPLLLNSWTGVPNPKRVETLTHFELMEYWYAQRWCKYHGGPHIEWFKIDVAAASSVAGLWSQWMKRANPHDRRGHLKRFWKETIDFLTMHEVPITARVMIEVQDLEDGSSKLLEFIDDDALRKRRGPAVKQEQIGTSQVINSLPTLAEVGHTPRAVSDVKSGLVKKEVKERLSSS